MGHPPELIELTVTEREPLLARMAGLAERRDGWVNLQPVPPEEAPNVTRGRAGLFGLLSGRGPDLPIATWVPGELTRRGVEPDSIGLQHGGGPKARLRLAELGVPIPTGWRVLADHPRRGLVIELPPATPPAEALDWLLRAATALSPVELPERWVALVYQR
jgi:hypothetical protein